MKAKVKDPIWGYTRGCAFQLKSLAHTSFFMMNAVLTPLCFLLMKAVADAGGAQSGGVSVAVAAPAWVDASMAGLWSSTTLAVGIIGYQRYVGTLQYLATSVVPPAQVFLPIVAAAAMLGCVGVPVSWVTESVLKARFVPVAGLQLFGYCLAVLACVASAALLAGLFVLFSRATVYEPLILLPIWMLSGIVANTDSLPEVVRGIALFHPLTSAVRVAHASTLSVEVVGFAALSILLTVLYMIIAQRMMHIILRKAIQEGSLNLL
ncbi:hypothetical protein B9G54_07385 [Alloscardovia macacae]|uniref:Uncharacterized protein n=2 Tax=Alloscardovia macacae TaxID=1160091 RepID=A0A1Y2T0A1_9BIFI|nr:hypothetical protein B9G54_07385 [Alloscardovia macacae]OTA28145.1 hypothetical protein B9T39_07405 [Alloscardovia macacae]